MMINALCIDLLLTILSILMITAEIQEISNIDEKDVPQLLKLLQEQPTYEIEKSGKHGHNDNADLNIDPLNLFLKRNGVEKNDISQAIIDNICKKTGRCACSGGKCDKNRIKETVEKSEEIEDFIQKLEKLLQGSEKDNLARCRDGRCKRVRDDNFRPTTYLKQQLELYGKKYKINDDLDAIVLKIDDMIKPSSKSKKRLDSLKFISNSLIDDQQTSNMNELEGIVLDLNGNKKSLLEKISEKPSYKKHKNLMDVRSSLKHASAKKLVAISPEDLAEYYEVYKHDITKKLLKYLRDPNADKQYIVKLPPKQQSLVDTLKLKVINGDEFDDIQLEKSILQIVFGNQSHSKVLPHGEGNDNIYVPNWLYKVIGESLNEKYLRAHKRMFPLTQQQKNKFFKNKSSRIWRRQSEPNLAAFGVPFELNLHALGQAVL